MSGHVLVVGGTGILAPAVVGLAARGMVVSIVSRNKHRTSDIGDIVLADVTNVPSFVTALGDRRFDLALAYLPFGDQAAWDVIDARADRVVQVLTSVYAAPDRPQPPLPGRPRLILGWHPTGRWHTPEEISAAALELAFSGNDAVLGVTRPWGERPA